MTKQDHINYWITSAAGDRNSIEALFNTQNYQQALFWGHLMIEKLIKAHWIKDNADNHPPRIHNLVFLHDQTTLNLDKEQTDFLGRLNNFQLEGRYPDLKFRMLKLCTMELSAEIIEQIKIIEQCLLNKL